MRTEFACGIFKSLFAAVTLSLALPACVSLSGAQLRVIDPRLENGGLEGLSVRTALQKFDAIDTTNEEERRQYRDFVISVYQSAIDMNFAEFSTRMSSERRELGLGIDLVTTAFTNYATVARQSIVNDLSAASAGFASARGAIDRNVYFDRTVPVFVASMEAERARIQARIEEGRHQPTNVYSLHDAFQDLRRLEAAGSIDRALADITSQATVQRQQAERELETPVEACEVVEDEATDLTDRLARFVRDLAYPPSGATDVAARTQALQQVGRFVGIPSDMLISASPAQIDTLIRRRLAAGVEGRCAAANYQSLIDRIRSEIGMEVPL